VTAGEARGEGETETVDEVLGGRLVLHQPRRGARVTMDPLLLVQFVLEHGARRGRLGRVLDVGTGTGVIACALALADRRAEVVAVEIEPRLAALAGKNAGKNHVADRVAVVAGDVRALGRGAIGAEHFDVVVANPPYTEAGRGRIPPAPDRAVARAETALTLSDVVELARRRLAPRGRLALILPAGRLGALGGTLAAARLELEVLRPVHSVAAEPARRILVLVGRGRPGATRIEPPLVIHTGEPKRYTAEATRWLGLASERSDGADDAGPSGAGPTRP
jgi:tRNA1(Val) A37 N6-methylase TrmN6